MTGPWNQLLFSLSNLSHAKFFDPDFSSAVVKIGLLDSGRKTEAGKPSLILPRGYTDGISPRNGGSLMVLDANGDWWANWIIRAEAWPAVEESPSKAYNPTRTCLFIVDNKMIRLGYIAFITVT